MRGQAERQATVAAATAHLLHRSAERGICVAELPGLFQRAGWEQGAVCLLLVLVGRPAPSPLLPCSLQSEAHGSSVRPPIDTQRV